MKATRRNVIHYFGIILFLLCCPLLLGADEVRTWWDDAGLFSIEATFEKLDGDSVQLKKTDGTVVTLPLARLAELDRYYVATHVRRLTATNPFESTAPVSSGDGETTSANAVLTAEIQLVDLSQTRDAGDVVPDVWNGNADPAPHRDYPAEVVRLNFRIPNTSINTQQARTGFFIDPAGKTAVHAFHIADPGNVATQRAATEERIAAQRAEQQARIAEIQARAAQRGNVPQSANPQPAAQPAAPSAARAAGKTQIFIGDTVSGNVITRDTPLKLVPLGFSPDGQRLLFRQEDWAFPPTGKQTLLHIVEMSAIKESAAWNAVASFEPFAHFKRSGLNASSSADINFATWADDEHILVRSGNGLLILLNVDTGTAIWQRQVESRGAITLSPGGKYCFLPIGNRTVLCETMTGKSVGAVDNAPTQKCFSPDGKRFAMRNTQGIILGDVTTGAVDAPFFVESGSSLEQLLFWLDDRHLFYGGEIVDTVSKSVVWTYTGLGDNVKLAGGYTWCFFSRSSRDGMFLAPVTIPHARVTARDISEDSESGLALKPGAEVALVLEDSIEKDRTEIRESIEKKVVANDWKIVPAAPVSIILKIEKEEADKVHYTAGRWSPLPRVPMPSRIFGGSGVPIEFQPERFSLSIMQGNTAIWSKDHKTTPPDRLPLDVIQNESLQEVVDKAMEEQSFQKWLDDVMIPRTISRPQEGKGTSRVTENGIEEVSLRR